LEKVYHGDNPNMEVPLDNLANILIGQGNFAEAEKVARRVLGMQRKFLGDGHPHVRRSYGILMYLLKRQAKDQEALEMNRLEYPKNLDVLATQLKLAPKNLWDREETLNSLLTVRWKNRQVDDPKQVANEFLPAIIQSDIPPRGILWLHASLYARSGRWNEAVTNLGKLAELDPDNSFQSLRLATLLVQVGDTNAYRIHCQKMIKRFGGSKDPIALDQAGKACMLQPGWGGDLDAAAELISRAIKLGKENEYIYYFKFDQGLANYRLRRYDSAIEVLGAIIGLPMKAGGSTQGWDRDASAYAVIAMAQNALNRPDKATKALEKADKLIRTQLPRPGTDDLGYEWLDMLIPHLLFREAKALIEGHAIDAVSKEGLNR